MRKPCPVPPAIGMMMRTYGSRSQARRFVLRRQSCKAGSPTRPIRLLHGLKMKELDVIYGHRIANSVIEQVP